MSALSKVQQVVVISFIFLLQGCGASTAPQTNYYLLATPTLSPSANDADLTVSSVILARYLDQRGIILVSNEREVNVAQYNFWAEPLDAGIMRLMNDKFDDARYPGFGELDINIDYLHGDELGNVLLEARWAMELTCGQVLVGKHIATQPQESDGYESLVTTQAKMIGDFVAAIFDEYSSSSRCDGD